MFNIPLHPLTRISPSCFLLCRREERGMMTGTGGDTRMNKPSRSVSQPWRRRWPYVSRDQIHPGGSGRAALKIRTKPSKSSLSLPLPKPLSSPPPTNALGMFVQERGKGGKAHSCTHACMQGRRGGKQGKLNIGPPMLPLSSSLFTV